jgi:tight adherence protein C
MLNLNTTRALFVTAVAVAIFSLIYALASAPSRVASRLGMRGLKRRRAIEDNGAWGQLEPMVRWFSVRVGGLIGNDAYARLDEAIALAGDYLGLTAEEYVSLSIVSSILFGLGAGVAGWALGNNATLFLIIGLGLGAAVPYLQISGEGQRRLKEINRGLPYIIDLMALGMSAGLDFPGAVRQVVEKSSNPEDPLIEEMTRVLQELQLGRTRKQALTDFAKRTPSPAVVEFVSALVQAEDRGNPVADVLQIQAGVSRMRRTVNAEEAAAKAGVKMVGPLFLLFACIMLLVMGPMILKLSQQSE